MKTVSLYCLFHCTRAEASRADLDPFHRLGVFIDCTYLLKVGVPNLFCLIVGMTHIVTDYGSLSTYVTNSGHLKFPLNK